jgi:transcriptional regulator with XRE-family HTH domain
MICSGQIKAARAMLGWSAQGLADASGVGPATIRRYEMQVGIPSGNTRVLALLKATLEEAGVTFTGNPLVNPGVTLNLEIRGSANG